MLMAEATVMIATVLLSTVASGASSLLGVGMIVVIPGLLLLQGGPG
jgi:hypothetical protein